MRIISSPSKFYLSICAALAALSITSYPSFGQIGLFQPRKPHNPVIDLLKSSRYTYSPKLNRLTSPDPIELRILDDEPDQTITIYADDFDGSPIGEIRIRGGLKIDQAGAVLTGRNVIMNMETENGHADKAVFAVGSITLRGERIDWTRTTNSKMVVERNLIATKAYFTTCSHKNPHFHITAKDLNLSSKLHAKAHNVGVHLNGIRLATLPLLEKDFGKSVNSLLPLPSYSKREFIVLRFADSAGESPRSALRYDAFISLRHIPFGELNYEYDLGKPDSTTPPPYTREWALTDPLRSALDSNPSVFHGEDPAVGPRRVALFGALSSQLTAFNGRRGDLSVSRYPEVGIAFRNLTNRKPVMITGKERSLFGIPEISTSRWVVNADISGGMFKEFPSGVQESRISTRIDAASPYYKLGRNSYFRAAGAIWGNTYGSGDSYLLAAPEAEWKSVLGRTLLGVGYKQLTDSGHTPFTFDRLDVRRSVRLRYGYDCPTWAFDTIIDMDADSSRAYDGLFAVRHRLDCMEFGLAYRVRSQSINVIFHLLPGRAAPRPVGTQ